MNLKDEVFIFHRSSHLPSISQGIWIPTVFSVIPAEVDEMSGVPVRVLTSRTETDSLRKPPREFGDIRPDGLVVCARGNVAH